jgi:hypothetical protein
VSKVIDGLISVGSDLPSQVLAFSTDPGKAPDALKNALNSIISTTSFVVSAILFLSFLIFVIILVIKKRQGESTQAIMGWLVGLLAGAFLFGSISAIFTWAQGIGA